MKKTHFPFKLWQFTGSDENLFALDPVDLLTFAEIVKEAP